MVRLRNGKSSGPHGSILISSAALIGRLWTERSGMCCALISARPCGGAEAVWIREALALGWGDTYQQVRSQAFDATRFNGQSFIGAEANPLGLLKGASHQQQLSAAKGDSEGRPRGAPVKANLG